MNKKLDKERYFRTGLALELLLNNKNEIRDKLPIVIKNFGQMYLRRIEASFGDVKLLIAGAIRDD